MMPSTLYRVRVRSGSASTRHAQVILQCLPQGAGPGLEFAEPIEPTQTRHGARRFGPAPEHRSSATWGSRTPTCQWPAPGTSRRPTRRRDSRRAERPRHRPTHRPSSRTLTSQRTLRAPVHCVRGRRGVGRRPGTRECRQVPTRGSLAANSGVSPAANMPSTCSTASRRFLMIGLPPKTAGFEAPRRRCPGPGRSRRIAVRDAAGLPATAPSVDAGTSTSTYRGTRISRAVSRISTSCAAPVVGCRSSRRRSAHWYAVS